MPTTKDKFNKTNINALKGVSASIARQGLEVIESERQRKLGTLEAAGAHSVVKGTVPYQLWYGRKVVSLTPKARVAALATPSTKEQLASLAKIRRRQAVLMESLVGRQAIMAHLSGGVNGYSVTQVA